MNITYKTTKDNINWEEVAGVLKRSSLSAAGVLTEFPYTSIRADKQQ